MTSNATKSKKVKTSKRTYVSSLVLASLFIALSVIFKMTFEIYFMPELRINFCSVPIMMGGILLGPIWGLAIGAISDILNFLIKPGGPWYYGFTLTSALSGLIPGLIFYLAKKKQNINYSALNIINFIILIGMIYLLRANGIITVAENAILIKGNIIPWYVIIVILAIFVLYSGTLILLLRKKETSQTAVPIDKIFFAVTCVEVICDLILNAVFLSDLYGMAMLGLLPMRFLKILVIIPIFSFVCFILCNIITRYKLQKK